MLSSFKLASITSSAFGGTSNFRPERIAILQKFCNSSLLPVVTVVVVVVVVVVVESGPEKSTPGEEHEEFEEREEFEEEEEVVVVVGVVSAVFSRCRCFTRLGAPPKTGFRNC
jgi:hypothetical protein